MSLEAGQGLQACGLQPNTYQLAHTGVGEGKMVDLESYQQTPKKKKKKVSDTLLHSVYLCIICMLEDLIWSITIFSPIPTRED